MKLAEIGSPLHTEVRLWRRREYMFNVIAQLRCSVAAGERQVRIAAGLLVLLGSTLGAFVHPYWIGLAAFVGAGLVVAGITDTCGMGMLLARMPWNRRSESLG